jgi:two-component system, chemotaxis family, sensor kinase Cph1
MTEDVRLEGGNELRRKAESMVPPDSESHEDLAGMSPGDIAKLIHELRVHQIELKMQNHELRRIQAELEQARDFYGHLYDFAPVAYFTLDEQGVTKAANLTAAALLGGQRSALVGRTFSEFVLKEDQDVWFLHRRRILETGNSQPFQLRLRKKDGTAFYADLQVMRVGGKDNAPAQIRITAVDITERKVMEEALQKAHDELELRVRERTADLESRNEELRDFTHSASHDLQEPLRKVKIFGDMLVERSEDGFLDEVSRDCIRRMQRAVERMRSLLDSLLVYSRVTTHPGELRRTDLRKSVDAALSNLELVIEEKGARVEVGELPTVDVYADQMIQVFQNLIENALKFRKEGEVPQVSIHACKEGKDNRVIEICVQDNGIGFNEEYLSRIFLPFQRLHGKSSEYRGMGMGLAICKKILERHGGNIDAKSAAGKGATFMVTLPAAGRTL